MGSEAGNFAHAIFLWDRLLKPYQSKSSFFSEFTGPKPHAEAMQKPGQNAAHIDAKQVIIKNYYSLFYYYFIYYIYFY